MILHVTVIGLLAYGFIFAPRINMSEVTDHYVMRRVEIDLPDPVLKPPATRSEDYPQRTPDAPRPKAGSRAGKAGAASGSPAPPPPTSTMRQVAQLHLSDRTVVQPDIPLNKLVVKPTPMPSLLLWSAQHPEVKLVVPPPPQILATINAKPVLTRPNPERTIADTPFAATPFTSKLKMPAPATTTPIAVRGPEVKDLIPETASRNSLQPTSAAMMSISEIEMAKGTIALAPVNQTAKGSVDGAMSPGTSGNAAHPGNGAPTSRGAGRGAGAGGGATGSGSGAAAGAGGGGSNGASGSGTAGGSGAGSGSTAQGGEAAGAGGEGSGRAPAFLRFSLPQNGQFGVVVVGSMSDQYPETNELWGRRLVYSVYLHVGTPSNWIMQYSMPLSKEAVALGNIHLEAPWPYYIVRPSGQGLENIGESALMIHGFISEAGTFEGLSVLFPPTFAQASQLLEGMRQWKFRPAKHNGQATRVEVVVVIPGE